MAKVCNKIETCKDFGENFSEKVAARNEFLAIPCNSLQIPRDSLQIPRNSFGMGSGWVATRKSPEAEAPGQVSVIKNYRYKAMLIELSLLDISLSAKRRVFSSSSENCDGLPFTILPLSLCASHERDFLK